MILITGGSDGLGLEAAKLLIAQGEQVMSLSRRKPQGGRIGHIVCDLNNEDSINAAAQEITAQSLPIKALINCAGVHSRQNLEDLTGSELARTFSSNIMGHMLLTARLLPRLKKDGADIVNVSSTTGTKGNKSEGAYGASKWAVRGFSQNLQTELQGSPCRVISFVPGGMRTGFFKKRTGQDFTDPENWMDPAALAEFMVQILMLPKNIEVSEVIINRKKV